MVRRFDAVIFDMDGVLIDSEPVHYAVLRGLMARDDLAMSTTQYAEFIGTTSEYMFQALMVRHGLRRSVAEYIALYDTALLAALETPREPQPGVPELIFSARALNMRLGVASSSREVWVEATLRSIGLADTWDAIVNGDEVLRGKPDPAIYLLAASRLGMPAERCLAIEDAPKGIDSARRAGMSVLGVRTPYTAHLELPPTDLTVDSLCDPLVTALVTN